MANKHRGEVDIFLDKKRTLRFNTHALAELEDALGYPLSKIDTESVGVKTILKMFWAGMLHHMPDLTIQEAADLMDYSNITEVSEKITEALELALSGPPQQKKAKNKVSGLNSVGKN